MDRMAENKELITQLDDVREAKKELDKEQRKIILDNQTLKLQLTKKINDQNNFHEKLYEFYKKVSQKEGQAAGVAALGGPAKESKKEPAKPKGRLYKGTPFLRGNTEDKKKILDMESGLEENDQQVLLLKLEKRSLQE